MEPWIAGIDVGVRMARAVLLDGAGRAGARACVPSGAFFTKAAEQVFGEVLSAAGIAREDVAYVTSTGYGRYQVPFRDLQVTEMTCHAAGAIGLFPGTRTVLDVGAQNTRVMGVTPEGRVARFQMNDKCAAGAGRFLERVSSALEVPLAEIGPIALQSHDPQPISSVCAVLAESEVINLVSQDLRTEDILLGIHVSICERIKGLVQQAGLKPELTLTGGMVHNAAMVRVLEEGLEITMNVSPESEYAGAYGAALLGRRRYDKRRKEGAS
ncbi:MAG: 2-hydroxyglutaryl-CoA dehydratase [Candidatus Latescibacteria bacterium]|nr:2-hydroxyglutaryl-CoA dehydratase [Candidatus Latescibacterota bacterium]